MSVLPVLELVMMMSVLVSNVTAIVTLYANVRLIINELCHLVFFLFDTVFVVELLLIECFFLHDLCILISLLRLLRSNGLLFELIVSGRVCLRDYLSWTHSLLAHVHR